jgi:hypothetical protein
MRKNASRTIKLKPDEAAIIIGPDTPNVISPLRNLDIDKFHLQFVLAVGMRMEEDPAWVDELLDWAFAFTRAIAEPEREKHAPNPQTLH